MKTDYQQFFFMFLKVLLFGILIHGLIIFLVDPLMNYRIPKFYKPYISNERYMNPGMAKNLKYDSILVGSSVTQIMVPSDFDSIFGGKTIKLSMNDITAYETNQILKVGLNANNIHRIYYGIDPFSFRGEVTRVAYKELPHFIYNNNFFDDYKYLLNTQILIKDIGMKLIAAKILGRKPNNSNSIDNPYYVEGNYSGKRLFDSWKSGSKNFSNESINFQCSNMIKSFDKNIVSLIKSNSEVDYYLFFPPYSILYWDRVSREEWIDDAICFKQYVAKFAVKNSNVILFDFQNLNEITFDLDNYENLRHFSPLIGRKIITMMKNNIGAVNYSNTYLQDFMTLKDQVRGLKDSKLIFSRE
jgi:hypothetical protein